MCAILRYLVGSTCRLAISATFMASMMLVTAACTLNSAQLAVSTAPTPGKPVNLTVTASADAYVLESSPNTNHGTVSTLFVNGSPGKESYLRFEVAGIMGTVKTAKLRVYIYAASSDEPDVYATENKWSETGLTWKNRPSRTSAAIHGRRADSDSMELEYDVTSLVTGNGTYSFVLSAIAENHVGLYAREASGNEPQLVVESIASTVPPTENLGVSVPGKPANPVVMAAGDLACDPGSWSYNGGKGTSTSCRQKYTSDILADGNPSIVLTLGDNQYENGELSKFRRSYDASWGRMKSITRPSVGNHEYSIRGAQGYRDYFGFTGRLYYGFPLGFWRLYALDSEECHNSPASCASGGPQYEWLQSQLAGDSARCTLAYWHHPRYSSGRHGSHAFMDPIWDLLASRGVELVLAGHDHNYERFAPIDSEGDISQEGGPRSFVVGTGGKSLRDFGTILPGSEVRNSDTFGVLKLELEKAGYHWQFVPEAGKTFTEAGYGVCR